jgi:hypothetical protein
MIFLALAHPRHPVADPIDAVERGRDARIAMAGHRVNLGMLSVSGFRTATGFYSTCHRRTWPMLSPSMPLNPLPNFVLFKEPARYGLGEILVSLQSPKGLPVNSKCSEYLLAR